MMKDLIGVWRDTRLIVLVAQTAAIYAAVLIPFKVGIPLIPGFAELRPANALPIVFSLLFGPVAAWGSGLGNLIGDCFGTLGPASVFGFLGNFFYGYVPYLLWGRLGPLSSGKEPVPRSWRQGLEFVVVCLAASAVCAVVIAWGVDLLGLVPFGILAAAIFFNNVLMALLLAPPLLFFLAPRVKRWGLRYEDIRASLRHEASGTRQVGTAPDSDHPQEASVPSPVASRPLPNPFVEIQSVTFTYQNSPRPALDGLTLSVDPGESRAVMGRNGTGKSTLCYALNGLIPHVLTGQWSGRITVNGFDTRYRPVWKQADTVGLLFQDFEAQLVSTNIRMELAFPLDHQGNRNSLLSPSEMHRRITDMLARVGLSGLERRNPLSLSGGQRQRLVIASILIKEPALIALDEPLTDLDPEGRRTLRVLLTALKNSGSTMVIAEHDSEEAALVDQISVLQHGRVAWEGKPRDLFGKPSGQVLARTLGLSLLPIATCFEELGGTEFPMSVEEAWQMADDNGLILSSAQTSFHHPTLDSPKAPPMESPPVIDVRQVSYEYERGSPAVADLSLTIQEGEFVALIGQNGSGKSTLGALLKGLLTPTQGRILVRGLDTRRLKPSQLAGIIGYVFQNPDHQIFAESVEQEVSFGLRNLGFTKEQCKDRVATALAAVGLDSPEVRILDPFSLTKGNRQRVAVASVLAAKPGVLIFDEPTTGLDVGETKRMMEMVKRLNQAGHTIIMITHSLSLVTAYARRCIIMREGRVLADGSTRDVFARLLNPDVANHTGLQVPHLTRFAARWGVTLLTVDEVKAALRKN